MKVDLRLLSDNALIPATDKDTELIETLAKNAIYSVEIKNLDSYTTRQNRALHLWFTLISNHFNHLQIPISTLHKKGSLWTATMVNIVKKEVEERLAELLSFSPDFIFHHTWAGITIELRGEVGHLTISPDLQKLVFNSHFPQHSDTRVLMEKLSLTNVERDEYGNYIIKKS